MTDWDPTPPAQSGITHEKAPAGPPPTSNVKLSGVNAECVISEPVGLGPGGIDPNPHSSFVLTAIS